MTRAAPAAFLGREFDDFLFSPIGDSGAGMPLTVLSALARQGVDPWVEAAKLAELPREDAARRLTNWIASLPDAWSAHPESGTVAARLIGLLPGRVSPVAQAQPGALPSLIKIPAAKSKSITAFAVLLAILIGAQIVVAMNQSPPTEPATATAAPHSAVVASPQAQAPISGR
jgi:hypothetical protein